MMAQLLCLRTSKLLHLAIVQLVEYLMGSDQLPLALPQVELEKKRRL